MHCLDCLVLLRLILSWPDLSALISFWSLHQAQQSIGVTAAPFSIDPDAYLNKYHKKRQKKKGELAGNQAWSLSFIRRQFLLFASIITSKTHKLMLRLFRTKALQQQFVGLSDVSSKIFSSPATVTSWSPARQPALNKRITRNTTRLL